MAHTDRLVVHRVRPKRDVREHDRARQRTPIPNYSETPSDQVLHGERKGSDVCVGRRYVRAHLDEPGGDRAPERGWVEPRV